VHPVVIPKAFKNTVLGLGDDSPMSGHLGINKTYKRVLSHLYKLKMKQDIVKYCKTYHVCQVVGKPDQTNAPAPLKPIPAFGEPFAGVVIDCVGPLPKTKLRNQYLLTIMCASTRFPEAFLLRNITTRTIVNALVKFFALFGLPKNVQCKRNTLPVFDAPDAHFDYSSLQ
jgi:hypothetical protein